ncbi:hypothetical protein Ccar_13980 [Clostridium carboxidivorans P7]|uniref:Uncharacterized protein n=1 Tax=Clostridium carboxidivorans P7 TaxID=536227 RepID=C6PS44_9CLOT|nr:hypothetical protein [Clostridium carboxidivorans]AKN31908.1 hypothetical protein Ccar_13980 [Clostridium carboxidivorans P7]EET87969.1 hypothetical protein CcarbDRAFT_1611 [Clostridium carboxidivorans P7]
MARETADKIQSFKDEIASKKYRFLVCHSSELDSLKIKTLEKNIEKEKTGMFVFITNQLNKESLSDKDILIEYIIKIL